MIIIFASFISRSRDKMGSFKNFLKLLIIYMIPVGLIVVEPDLSTSIVFVFLFIIMMFVGELGTRIILWILGISVPTLALFFGTETPAGLSAQPCSELPAPAGLSADDILSAV